MELEKRTEKLFVYGIFLDEVNRNSYGMTNPKYTTVPGYITMGGHIVKAVHVEDKSIALTGLIVDMDSERWQGLDSLEGGYDRIAITTVDGTNAFMYAEHQEGVENHSTYEFTSYKYRTRLKDSQE
jgi:gamma-glutamylcyclotransferase (GGCT)/AIG2-like uncharacterized protein YtfP